MQIKGTAPAPTRPNTAITSTVALNPARWGLKRWTLNLSPPANSAAPSTRSRLPRIEPVIDAFTSSMSPARKRHRGDDQLGEVAHRRVEERRQWRGWFARQPLRWPRPRTPDSGTIATRPMANTAIGGQCRMRATMAIGTNTSSA